MNSHPTLQNAPIIEAVVDIRVAQRQNFEMNALKDAHAFFKDRYPIQREQRLFQSHFEHHNSDNSPKVETTDRGISGYQYLTDDEKELIQFKRDGFSFNRLRPYSNWDTVKQYAASAWEIYNKSAQPLTLTRLALRYINKLTFDLRSESVQEYMNLPLALPSEFKENTVDSFVYRTTINGGRANLKAHYTLAREKTIHPYEFSVIVDIDAFEELGDSPANAHPFKQLEELRQLKNDLFFKTLTAKGVDKYK